MLDTHIAIWAVATPDKLSTHARDLIMAPDNIIYVSAVSILEIAIKFVGGKDSAPSFGASKAIVEFRRAGYVQLDVTAAHAAAVETLPLLHRNPFDRLLVAQAFSEPMQLLTRDRMIGAYGRGVLMV